MSANGGRLASNVIYEITMTINKRQVKYPFHVLPKLGIDFIKQNKLQLCAKHQNFDWVDTCLLDHDKTIRATKDTTILPGETQVCTININSFDPNHDRHVLAEIKVPNRPWIIAAPTLATPDKTKIALHILLVQHGKTNSTRSRKLP